MIDDAPRPSESRQPEPDSSQNADCRLSECQAPISQNPTGESAVVAARVTRTDAGRLMFSIPLKSKEPGGAGLFCVLVDDDPVLDLSDLVTLPIKDLANPGVALVVRSSLERLVRASRVVFEGEPREMREVLDSMTELEAALEPFKDVAP